ncbi:flagellar filament capping protein FliD [Chitinimonas sp. BJYL2]|uniref:flagellar filament capping protein FliD n=1 Tax=Chitinimonas sp. BJYL2 TaxID=2976696 RepID=UPI0022B5BB47|nr:flagellar filament capping protein FliD [Chitinimonas sp. BJYL2]
MSIKHSSQIGFDPTQLNALRDNSVPADKHAFAVQLAQFQSETMNTLIRAALSDPREQESGSMVSGSDDASGNPLLGNSMQATHLQGLSASGRNMSLLDPEAGYKMMSLINTREVSHKAEFAALTQMQGEVAGMRAEGAELAELGTASSNAQIRAELQEFVDEYNQWVREFDDEMQAGGALANSNAAKMSRYELGQSIENPFMGAQHGVKGMAALGIRIDPISKQAVFDPAQLDATLASHRTGALQTLDDFSAHFAKSAELLNADNNFIRNRLANLDRVIHYINTNKTSLQAEFGLGDSARPNAGMAQALAAYQAMLKDKKT